MHIRQGDRDAFGELVRSYRDPIFNVNDRLAGVSREAEGLALVARIPALLPIGSPGLVEVVEIDVGEAT